MKKIKLKNLINELIDNRNTDILDKTKCSVTAKNIYNYIVEKYTDNKKIIEWNDTLFENYMKIDEFNEHKNRNKIFYVYYDHITGETSHYFIILYSDKGNFKILQSAVFEYSMMDWIDPVAIEKIHTKWGTDEIDLIRNEQEKKDNNEKDNLIKRLQDTKNISNKQFIENLIKLQGSWKNDCDNMCKLFTQNFACKMDNYILSKKFALDDKQPEFRFRYSELNVKLIF